MVSQTVSTRPPALGWGIALAAICAVGAAIYAVMALTSSGPATWIGALTCLALLLVAAAALLAMSAPRRALAQTLAAAERTEIVSPLALTAALLGAWLLLVVSAGAWVVLGITDLDAVETPGAALVIVLGTLGSAPEAVRLIQGRLHRWRIVVDDRGLTYRGYHTDVTVTWAQVRGADLHHAKPIGVLVDLKASRPDFVIPSTAFLVPADQIVGLIQKRVSR